MSIVLSPTRVIILIVLLYVFIQIIILAFTSGVAFGETRKVLIKIKAHEMFRGLYSNSNEELNISDLDGAISMLRGYYKKPITYIWFSIFFRRKSMIHTLKFIRKEFEELVMWYNNDVKYL